ncbi:unnamed protein product [Bursaphelenchus okinawaensis]|uniref:DUF1907 domain-containing protein n=1 Tax=Bursaphelenchus okinawaensis TaxID=465554 RepID=A0A811LDW3_9BILA|nr:unnamed protein product [Bursaphelenchus okinawaensis]CAG9120613.1 unnamed protein product [Bursaphelenchus okinawaensis]
MSKLVDYSNKLTKIYTNLHKPALKELSGVLERGLKKNFAVAKVEVTKCPDLTAPPYNMTLAKNADLPNGWVFGPGAGPRESLGKNCELVANVNFKTNQINCHHGLIAEDEKSHVAGTHTDLCLQMFANLAMCSDEPAQDVLRIQAKKRLSKEEGSFTEIIQGILAENYSDDRMLCMAGIWQFVKGRGRFHVVPDYPEKEFESFTQIFEEWLHYFEFSAPMTMTTVIHSSVLDMNVPVEHTHGFTGRGHCGHYHGDVTPDEAEYDGYFMPASKLYKFD